MSFFQDTLYAHTLEQILTTNSLTHNHTHTCTDFQLLSDPEQCHQRATGFVRYLVVKPKNKNSFIIVFSIIIGILPLQLYNGNVTLIL